VLRNNHIERFLRTLEQQASSRLNKDLILSALSIFAEQTLTNLNLGSLEKAGIWIFNP
jgi:hypothetical protein